MMSVFNEPLNNDAPLATPGISVSYIFAVTDVNLGKNEMHIIYSTRILSILMLAHILYYQYTFNISFYPKGFDEIK